MKTYRSKSEQEMNLGLHLDSKTVKYSQNFTIY